MHKLIAYIFVPTESQHLEMIWNLTLDEGPNFQLVQQNQLPEHHVIGKSTYYVNKAEFFNISNKKW